MNVSDSTVFGARFTYRGRSFNLTEQNGLLQGGLDQLSFNLFDVFQDLGFPHTSLDGTFRTAVVNSISLSYSLSGQEWKVALKGLLDNTAYTVDVSKRERASFSILVLFDEVEVFHDDDFTVICFTPKTSDPIDLAKRLNAYLPEGLQLPAELSRLSIRIGSAALVCKKDGADGLFLSLTLLSTFDLSMIPVVGSRLPKGLLELTATTLIYTRHAFTLSDLQRINTILKTKQARQLPAPKEGFNPGFTLHASLSVEGRSITLSPGVPEASTSTGSTASVAGGQPAASQNNIHWIKIQKSLGPLYLNKLGLQFSMHAVPSAVFILDASAGVSALTVTLEGLAVQSALTELDFSHPQLDGIGVLLNRPPLKLGGSLVKESVSIGSKELTEYNGSLILNMEEVTLSALGSFTAINGHPSFLVYGFLDYPIGGPPSVFITGIAAGLGLNRKMLLPQVDQLDSFPLVAVVNQSNPTLQPLRQMTSLRPSQLADLLGQYFQPELGEFFLAGGLRFTTYEIIQSFALLMASFGDSLDFSLSGESTLTLPPDDSDCLSRMQVAYEATYNPGLGFIGLEGVLTPNSYVFNPFCRLSGGYAYYVWLKGEDGGPQAGDFVYTAGGYATNYHAKSWYPSVPRIGMKWVVGKDLHIKASGYFALIPNMMMAGGELSADFHAGGDDFYVTASFYIGADFLIVWKPFHYKGVIKAGFRVKAHAHLLFIHVTIDLDCSADMHIWGPSFSGHARIRIHVLFTFHVSVSWGDSKYVPPPLSWQEFKSAFLPSTGNVCHINIKNGLLKKAPDGYPIIDPQELIISIHSAIPSCQGTLHLTDGSETPVTITSPTGSIDVHPMGAEGVNCQSSLHITLQVPADQALTYDNKSLFGEESSEWEMKNFPAALWCFEDDSAATAVSGKSFLNAVGGFNLVAPAAEIPDKTRSLSRQTLRYDIYLGDADPKPQWESDPGWIPLTGLTLAEAEHEIETSPPSATLLKELGFLTVTPDLANISLLKPPLPIATKT